MNEIKPMANNIAMAEQVSTHGVKVTYNDGSYSVFNYGILIYEYNANTNRYGFAERVWFKKMNAVLLQKLEFIDRVKAAMMIKDNEADYLG